MAKGNITICQLIKNMLVSFIRESTMGREKFVNGTTLMREPLRRGWNRERERKLVTGAKRKELREWEDISIVVIFAVIALRERDNLSPEIQSITIKDYSLKENLAVNIK